MYPILDKYTWWSPDQDKFFSHQELTGCLSVSSFSSGRIFLLCAPFLWQWHDKLLVSCWFCFLFVYLSFFASKQMSWSCQEMWAGLAALFCFVLHPALVRHQSLPCLAGRNPIIQVTACLRITLYVYFEHRSCMCFWGTARGKAKLLSGIAPNPAYLNQLLTF